MAAEKKKTNGGNKANVARIQPVFPVDAALRQLTLRWEGEAAQVKRKKTNREGNLHRGPEDTMEAPRAIKRRRSREEPAERRRKDRYRKRRKRGQTADAPAVDGSSTDSEVDGNTE